MPMYVVDSEDLVNIADVIRAKGGTSASLEFPNGFISAVGSIGGKNQFVNLLNKSITTVTAKDLEGVTQIGDYAFFWCNSLTSVTIPDSVKYIGESAFADCFSLTSIIIPDSVTSIGQNAFYGCAMTSITIPNNVRSIPDYTFADCVSLTSVTCKAITPPVITKLTFTGVKSNCNIYVPAQSVEAYKAAPYWSDRANYIQAIP